MGWPIAVFTAVFLRLATVYISTLALLFKKKNELKLQILSEILSIRRLPYLVPKFQRLYRWLYLSVCNNHNIKRKKALNGLTGRNRRLSD